MPKNWCFWTVVLEKTLESPLDCKEIHWSILRKSVLNIHWKDWCWNWNSNTLATWYEKLTQLKRPWCWEWLKLEGEGDDRGWDSWMASPTQWTCFWVSSGSWWWTDIPQSMGSQRVRHYWATELNWIVWVANWSISSMEYYFYLKEGRFTFALQRIRWWGGITDLMDRSLSKLWKLVMDREAWSTEFHGVAKSWTRQSNWTELNSFQINIRICLEVCKLIS